VPLKFIMIMLNITLFEKEAKLWKSLFTRHNKKWEQQQPAQRRLSKRQYHNCFVAVANNSQYHIHESCYLSGSPDFRTIILNIILQKFDGNFRTFLTCTWKLPLATDRLRFHSENRTYSLYALTAFSKSRGFRFSIAPAGRPCLQAAFSGIHANAVGHAPPPPT